MSCQLSEPLEGSWGQSARELTGASMCASAPDQDAVGSRGGDLDLKGSVLEIVCSPKWLQPKVAAQRLPSQTPQIFSAY